MSKKKARWRKLDNAAKLYSAASNKKDTRVFRFYCELKEEVNPDVLQEALNQTIEEHQTKRRVRLDQFGIRHDACNDIG